MILRRDKLCEHFADFIEDFQFDEFDDDQLEPDGVWVETCLFIDEWLEELCKMGPDWVADWQDVYMQLTGEHVQLWRELRELIETISRMEIEHAKHFQPNYPHGNCDGECCKSKI